MTNRAVRVWSTIVLLSLAGRGAAQEAPVVRDVLLHAGAAGVWEALTCAEGLVRCFGAGIAEVELRNGGNLRTHHDGKAKLGDPGTIVLEVVAVESQRLVVLRTPAAPEGREKSTRGTCSLRLEPLGPDRTRLVVTQSHWRLAGPDGAHLLLGEANPWTLAKVQQACAQPVDASAPGPCNYLLRLLVGGTWMAISGTDTARLSVQVRIGAGIELEEWRGAGKAPVPYERIDVHRDEAVDAMAFVAWHASGEWVTGHVRLPAPGLLEFAAIEPARIVRRLQFASDGKLVDDGKERFVYERKDAIPQKLR